MAPDDSSSRLLSQDEALRARALKVIPGGMWGHMNVARLPPGYPQFFRSASGCRLRDMAGTEYVDLMCGYGPIVLGYGDPDVEAAATAQRGRGDLMTGPAECQIELAELVVETIPHADWVLFAKNGTDATTACVTIARAGTQRRKVLVAKGSYHGAAPWCTPSLAGVTAEDRAHILHFDYNDVPSLELAADEAGCDLAAVLVTAFKHDVRRHQEAPTPAFTHAVRRICNAAGAALILDDVRAGFRLHTGGSWEPYGVRPDLCAWSKAIANGHPLAAVTGTDRFRDAAQQVYVTGSFWCSAVPMAAAIATIKKLRATGAIATMEAMGHRLRDGLEAQARAHDIRLRQTGPVQMPMIMFEDDPDFVLGYRFVQEALRRGAYMHPWHNMFLCAAHQADDIDRVLEATNEALKQVAALVDRRQSAKAVQ
ncbi:aminotransferase class III-fold pyridoxal phosphate-dependent enzyme [Bradyrhizobium commune]|uniref:Aminotransferase class III-fold pyridoxal phosphate-dependent enzyme n=1 Tax=Bradyrhizobium commune TaxID=83627 RepID=A0A7S9D192_9BRAD|nr:aminotransferase class III-fold pyridoxal phosphate-dependent enzyme [Bradyrhizobium commune]QPF89315.1 aminotransferase class III-fold pyridoxal phosphate-dependent enzyme [Bradyrhizobium commune]